MCQAAAKIPLLRGVPLNRGYSVNARGWHSADFIACPWTLLPTAPSCHIRPPESFQVAQEGDGVRVGAWWRDVQCALLCWEEDTPREGQGLAQSHTASLRFEQTPPSCSSKARGLPLSGLLSQGHSVFPKPNRGALVALRQGNSRDSSEERSNRTGDSSALRLCSAGPDSACGRSPQARPALRCPGPQLAPPGMAPGGLGARLGQKQPCCHSWQPLWSSPSPGLQAAGAPSEPT